MANEINSANEFLKTLASNKVARIIFFALIIIGSGIFVFIKLKPKPDECGYYKEQNRQLVNALLDIKKDVRSLSEPVSYHYNNTGFSFASYDSTPKPKDQRQEKIDKLGRKLDSILRMQQKQDSIQRSKQ